MRQVTSKHEMMTPINKLWPFFRISLEKMTTQFKCDHTHTNSKQVMSFMNVEPCCQLMSIGYFYASGGFCDCEVLMNVGVNKRGKPGNRFKVKKPAKKAKVKKARKE